MGRFSGRDDGHERFARAVESAADSRSLEADDRECRDELAMVGALRRLGEQPALDAEARERIAARAAERREPRPRPAPAPTDRQRRPSRRGPVAAAAVAVLIALGGLGVLLSGDALPGDALYDLKQLREATVLELTFDDEEKAFKHLEYAERRLDELETLAARDAGADAFAVALRGFSKQAAAGTSQLTAIATGSDGHQLRPLRLWAAAQSARVSPLRPELPPRPEPQRLLTRIQERANALAERMDCYEVTSGEFDELGALPAEGACRAGGDAFDGLPDPVPTTPPERTTEPEEPLAVLPRPPSTVPGTPASEPVTGPTTPRLPDGTSISPPPVIEPPIPTVVPGPPPPGGDATGPPAVSVPPLLPGLPRIGNG